MKTGEWTLRSRRVVTPSGTRAADVLIRRETIVDLLAYDAPESEGVILDAGDLAVLPGLVALYREPPEPPGSRWFEAATRDSAAGGVTTLVDLPPRLGTGSVGVPASASISIGRMAVAGGMIRVDCGLVIPLARGEVDRIEAWIEAGFLGIEAVLDGESGENDRSATSANDLQAAMPILALLGRPVLVDLGRPSVATSGLEPAVVRFLIRLCRATSCRVHLIRPSAVDSLAMIAEAHAEGIPLSVETCPQHLGFDPGAADGDSLTSLPDLGRPTADAQARLWQGLESGWINAIGPDVATPTSEDGPLREALSAAWTVARPRGLTLDQVARWMADATATTLGLTGRKGSIAPGFDADFVVFDPEATTETSSAIGRVEATILRGTLIYHDGRLIDHPRGSVVLRIQETQPIHGRDA